ncbi:MAG: hypothetical protein HQ478_12605 [Chloroflexi bacterium]|nr:hypothetical protein [Chloroflexota bacterium]
MSRGHILNRPLQRVWLDAALRAVREYPEDEDRRLGVLSEVLDESELGSMARQKTLVILRKIWWEPRPEASAMIKWAIQSEHPADTRVLHIGAMLANFPFTGDVYRSIGNVLKRGSSVSSAETRRRVVGEWGDRESIHKAVLMAINTLISLEILGGDRLSDERSLVGHLDVPERIGGWLTHALILTRNADSVDRERVWTAPELFPFDATNPSITNYPLLESFNEGGSRVVIVPKTVA